MPDFAVSHEQGVDDSHAWLLTITGDLDTATVQPLDNAFDAIVAVGGRFVTSLQSSAVLER